MPLGLWIINDIVKEVLEQSAAVISAAADVYKKQDLSKRKKALCITSLGATGNIFLQGLKPALEDWGIAAVVFHASGLNTRVVERAIREVSLTLCCTSLQIKLKFI